MKYESVNIILNEKNNIKKEIGLNSYSLIFLVPLYSISLIDGVKKSSSLGFSAMSKRLYSVII